MYTGANMGEALEMRIYDRNFEMSDNQMQVMLDKAALEEHGFKLEIISKLVRDPESESDKPVYQKAYYYYKTVDCSQVPEVNEELDSLIPDNFQTVWLNWPQFFVFNPLAAYSRFLIICDKKIQKFQRECE